MDAIIRLGIKWRCILCNRRTVYWWQPYNAPCEECMINNNGQQPSNDNEVHRSQSTRDV